MSLAAPGLRLEVADGVTRFHIKEVCVFSESRMREICLSGSMSGNRNRVRPTGLRRVVRKHPNSHREAKATAPVLDSTRHNTHCRILSASPDYVYNLGKVDRFCREVSLHYPSSNLLMSKD